MVSPAKLSPIEVRRLMVIQYGVGVYPSKQDAGRVDLESRWDFHLRTGYHEAEIFRRKRRQIADNRGLMLGLFMRQARTSIVACAFAVSAETVLGYVRKTGLPTLPRKVSNDGDWNRVINSRRSGRASQDITFSIGDAFQVVNRHAAQHGRVVIEAGKDHSQAQAPAG